MQELIEFRVDAMFAHLVFSEDEGNLLGDSVKRVFVDTNDRRLIDIGRLQSELRRKYGKPFFYGWAFHRRYNQDELALAKCFQLIISSSVEPSGEECGTKYDESTSCPKCGSGSKQVSDLRLDLRKMPKAKKIAITIAGEIIVSQYLAERMIDAELTGFDLRPVQHKSQCRDEPIDLRLVPTGRSILENAEAAGFEFASWEFYVWLNRAENRALLDKARAENAAMKGEGGRRHSEQLPVWHQLVLKANNAQIVPPTRVGIDPFDEDTKGEYRCTLGDLIGLNLLSEVSISAVSWSNADITGTHQFIGTRRGLLRPNRVILISQKMRRLFQSEKLRGFSIEVVNVV